jgi:peptide chain release factor 3
MDMPARDPLDLMTEVEDVLQIQSYAMNWPIGNGKEFQGVYDRMSSECVFFTKTSHGGAQKADMNRTSLAAGKEIVYERAYQNLLEELELLEGAGNSFSRDDFLAGKVTPVFFASALTNFGVEPFFDAFIHLAPCPHARLANKVDGTEISIDPAKEKFSGYIFKLQANMDKRHRDSMAFIRICSGFFERDLYVKNQRTGKEVRLASPHGMLAGERTTLESAFPGDVIGVINSGGFAIGDTISIDGGFNFKPLPQFQPEIFARLQVKDVSKRKSFDKGITQLVSEGAIQMLHSQEYEGDLIFAAVGQLQFEVMQYRLKDEYNVDTTLTSLPYHSSAWIIGDMAKYSKTTSSLIVLDRFNRPMALFQNAWDKQYSMKQNPQHELVDVLV